MARYTCVLAALALIAAACSEASEGTASDAAAVATDVAAEGVGGSADADPTDPGSGPDLPPDPGPDVPGDAAPDAAGDVVADPGQAAGDEGGVDAVAPADAADDVGPADVAQDVPAADTGGSTIGAQCFPALFDPSYNGPDYDQFSPIVGSHCVGTNHQAITGVEQVVFLGDSVTVGTPNDVHPLSIDNSHFYRNLLAEWLRTEFGVDHGDDITWGFWKTYDYVSGKGGVQTAGAFHNCSKWGARTDDLMTQIGECLPAGGSDAVTLVVFTMGGNDIASITQAGGEASPEEVAAGYPEAWALAESTVTFLEEAIVWLKDPTRFPKGAHVVFANPFEFTDSTGQVDACSPETINIPGLGAWDVADLGLNMAGLAGFQAWAQPEVQEAIVIWLMEEYQRISVAHQVDLVWLLEAFCGHGYVATGADADTSNRCYLGSDADLYFDVTCIHPSDAGHKALADLFQQVIAE